MNGQLAMSKFYLSSVQWGKLGGGWDQMLRLVLLLPLHCCWTYLIIAFHFVLGKRRKLNANSLDTNSSSSSSCGGIGAVAAPTITPTIIVIITKAKQQNENFIWCCVKPNHSFFSFCPTTVFPFRTTQLWPLAASLYRIARSLSKFLGIISVYLNYS